MASTYAVAEKGADLVKADDSRFKRSFTIRRVGSPNLVKLGCICHSQVWVQSSSVEIAFLKTVAVIIDCFICTKRGAVRSNDLDYALPVAICLRIYRSS